MGKVCPNKASSLRICHQYQQTKIPRGQGGLGRRQPGLGSKLSSEASGRISEDPAQSPPVSSLGQEQGLLEVELHPEERLGVFN